MLRTKPDQLNKVKTSKHITSSVNQYFAQLLQQIVLRGHSKKYGRSYLIKVRSLEKPFSIDPVEASEVLKKHEGLLKTVIKRYINIGKKYGLSYEELMQIGSIGLIRGYEAYVAAPNDRKISTFLAHAIEWDILDCIYTNFSIIRIPKSTLNKKLKEIGQKLKEENPEGFKRVTQLPILVLSDDSGMELTPDAKDIFKQSEHHFLEEAIIDVLAHLSPLESDVLTQTFLKGQSIENAAKTLKLTRALVRDTKEAALNKIRTNPDLTQKLIDFYV